MLKLDLKVFSIFLIGAILMPFNTSANDVRNILLIDPLQMSQDDCGLFSKEVETLLAKRPGDYQLAVFLSDEEFAPLPAWVRAGDRVTYLAVRQHSTKQSVRSINEKIKEQGASLEVVLFATVEYSDQDSSDWGVKITQSSCIDPDEGEYSTPAITRKTRQLIAAYLHIPLTMILPETDLLADLGVDQIGLYELNLYCTEAFDVVPVPRDKEIEKVSDLIAYIQGAEELVASRGVVEEGEAFIQTVFYATNRQTTNYSDPEQIYNGERNVLGELNYGLVEVSIPKSHKSGVLETPFMGIRTFLDPKDHLFVKLVNPMSGERFKRVIEEAIGNAGDKDFTRDAIVFVHGFNVSFEMAARRTAQIAFDIKFPGLPMFFSWPSDAKLLGYMSDREDAIWSAAYIEEFLKKLTETEGIENIHLIAHSMGSQALLGALHRMAMKQREKSVVFKNIILAAPDFDAELFEQQIAPEVRHLAKTWTVYTSDKDTALNFSSGLNNADRLGMPITPLEGFSVIDATGVEVSPWNVPEFHSYYATKSRVITDITATIYGKSVAERNLERKTRAGSVYWELR